MKSMNAGEKKIIDEIQKKSYGLTDTYSLDPLMERIGNARVVMLGEASHGTHEYYTWRSKITQRLIREKNFNFIAVEGDWPDCYTLNRYIKNYESVDLRAEKVVHAFQRWPTWMWANWEVIALSEWLRDHNRKLAQKNQVGFYGLDVYSLTESMEAIMNYLEKNDPSMLPVAEAAFRCFEPYGNDGGQEYALASRFVSELCEDEVVGLLKTLRMKIPHYKSDPENVFSAEQNALVAVNAEKYYRAMVLGGADSWNVRDSHMMETLERLLNFHGPHSKAVIWAHNTHIGDSRATDMARAGMYNIGELARINFPPEDVVLVGFGSYSGSVIAGKNWGAPMQEMRVPEGIAGSWENMLHAASAENKLLIMDHFTNDAMFDNSIGHRAIGVVYHPEREWGNYVPSILPMRYDAFIYLDQTQALHPVHFHPHGHKIPETYPFGV